MDNEQESSADVVGVPRLHVGPAGQEGPVMRRSGAVGSAPTGTVRPVGRASPGATQDRTATVPGQRRASEDGDPVAPPAAPAPSRSAPRVVPDADDRDLRGAVARARTALALGPTPLLVEDAVEVRAEVDADGAVRSTTWHTRWRAVGPGARRAGVVRTVPVPVHSRPVAAAVEAVEGCSTGRTYADLREGVLVTALELPVPLVRDACAWTTHRTTGAPVRTTHLEHRVDGPVEELRLEVHFDRVRAPGAGEAYVRTDDGEVVVPLPVVEGSLRWVGRPTEACTVGVRWCW